MARLTPAQRAARRSYRLGHKAGWEMPYLEPGANEDACQVGMRQLKWWLVEMANDSVAKHKPEDARAFHRGYYDGGSKATRRIKMTRWCREWRGLAGLGVNPKSPWFWVGIGTAAAGVGGLLWLLLKPQESRNEVSIVDSIKAVWTYNDQRTWAKMMDGILASLGLEPAARLVAIAHGGIETTMGTAGSSQSWRTFNFWNITAGTTWSGPTLIGGDMEYGVPKKQAWRVYADAEAAARDYLQFLSATDYKLIEQPGGGLRVATASYKQALDKMLVGDAEGFARTLRLAGYYTEDVEKYVGMMKGQLKQAQKYLAS